MRGSYFVLKQPVGWIRVSRPRVPQGTGSLGSSGLQSLAPCQECQMSQSPKCQKVLSRCLALKTIALALLSCQQNILAFLSFVCFLNIWVFDVFLQMLICSPIRLAYEGFLLCTKATGGLDRGVPTPGSSGNRLPGFLGPPEPGSLSRMSNVKCHKVQNVKKVLSRCLALKTIALALLGGQQHTLAFLSFQKLLWHC